MINASGVYWKIYVIRSQNILFVTYVSIFRYFSNFTYVKIIKDHSLTRQREHSNYSKRNAQCRTRQYFRITLKKIEKKEKTYQSLLEKHRYIYAHKKGINTQLCTIGKTFPPSRNICTLKVWGAVRLREGKHRQWRDWESRIKWILLKEIIQLYLK